MYAVAITLLVLDIALPVSANRDLLGAVTRLWPSLLAYVVSFATIGASWLGHNAITEYLDRANATFVRLNLLLLLLIAFLPFPAGCSPRHREGPARAGRVHDLRDLPATVVHPALGAVAVRGARPAGRPDAADEDIQFLTQRLTPGLAGYLVLIVAGLFVPVIAVAGYLAIALYYVFPFRRFGQFRVLGRGRRRRGPSPDRGGRRAALLRQQTGENGRIGPGHVQDLRPAGGPRDQGDRAAADPEGVGHRGQRRGRGLAVRGPRADRTDRRRPRAHRRPRGGATRGEPRR